MRPGFLATVVAVILGSLPIPAHAQYVSPLMVAAALSPLLVLLLCVILGLLTRSVRTGALHTLLVIVWVVLFSLASYFVENDYVIWTPLSLYVLHAVILIVLIMAETMKRARDG